jgi:hypothetical protein
MKMEQQQELVDNPTHCFISVHSVLISALDRGMIAVHPSPSWIQNLGLNPALAKKFNIARTLKLQ